MTDSIVEKYITVQEPSALWYKDKGGASNFLEWHIQVTQIEMSQRSSVLASPSFSLFYEDGTLVPDQSILILAEGDIAHETCPSLLNIRFQIRQVSRAHRNQCFCLKLVDGDTSITSAPIRVLSKPSNKRRQPEPVQNDFDSVSARTDSPLSTDACTLLDLPVPFQPLKRIRERTRAPAEPTSPPRDWILSALNELQQLCSETVDEHWYCVSCKVTCPQPLMEEDHSATCFLQRHIRHLSALHVAHEIVQFNDVYETSTTIGRLQREDSPYGSGTDVSLTCDEAFEWNADGVDVRNVW